MEADDVIIEQVRSPEKINIFFIVFKIIKKKTCSAIITNIMKRKSEEIEGGGKNRCSKKPKLCAREEKNSKLNLLRPLGSAFGKPDDISNQLQERPKIICPLFVKNDTVRDKGEDQAENIEKKTCTAITTNIMKRKSEEIEGGRGNRSSKKPKLCVPEEKNSKLNLLWPLGFAFGKPDDISNKLQERLKITYPLFVKNDTARDKGENEAENIEKKSASAPENKKEAQNTEKKKEEEEAQSAEGEKEEKILKKIEEKNNGERLTNTTKNEDFPLPSNKNDNNNNQKIPTGNTSFVDIFFKKKTLTYFDS
jgi:hypothetical protein